MTDRLLLVGADAERRAPTLSLLRFVGWMSEHRPDARADVVLLAGGPLEREFRSRMPTTVVDGSRSSPRPGAGLEDRLLRARPGLAPWWHEHQVATRAARHIRRLARHDLVYVADVRAMGILRLLPPAPRRVLAHVHERDVELRHLLPTSDRRALVDRTDHLLAGSELVREDLLRTRGLGTESVTTHALMVDAPVVRRRGSEGARAAWGLPEGTLVVGAGGSGGWRDGFDLLARVAAEVRRSEAGEATSFLWAAGAGGPEDPAPAPRELAGDLDLTFLQDPSYPPAWPSLVDVLVVPARSDDVAAPALEAGRAGVPFVCFDHASSADLALGGGGLVAPYPSPFLLADTLRTLLADERRRQAVGERGAEWVTAHHDTTVRAPALWAEIEGWRS